MASTLTRQADSPGGGARGEVSGVGSRALSVGVYKLAFGNPYVVGGENIAAIWEDFKDVTGIVVSQNDVTIADRREVVVDLTNKKAILFTAFNTESGAVDQTAVGDVRLIAFGYR
jgi:hypothetical protein